MRTAEAVVDAEGSGQWMAGVGGCTQRRHCLPSIGTAASTACTAIFLTLSVEKRVDRVWPCGHIRTSC